jgi:glutamate dehydrogenase
MITLAEIAGKSHLSLEDVLRLEDSILASGYMSREKTRQEIAWFLTELGIDEYYFRNTAIEDMARHLIAISASRLVSQHGGEEVGLQLINEQEGRAFYIVEERSAQTEEIENRIEERYPLCRLESYLTRDKSGLALRFYRVTRPEFAPGEEQGRELTFELAADRTFLAHSMKETVERYRVAWEAMKGRETPYIAISEKGETNETRIMVGIHSHRTEYFLTAFSHLLYTYGIHSKRKYREIFRDRKRIYSFYFDRLERKVVGEFVRDLIGVMMLPKHPIAELFSREIYSPHQTLYAISAAAFTHQFLSVHTEDYASLAEALRDKPEARGVLDNLRLTLTKDAYSQDRIARTVLDHHELVAAIYEHFQARLNPARQLDDAAALERELAQERDITARIDQQVPVDQDKTILKFFLTFNQAILRTNFFIQDKRCLSYKLNPSVASATDYPERIYALFFFVGREFLGFHLRFRDIARGGIRIVKSRHHAEYLHNLNTIFSENYQLACTQQKKNKDIPEGGAKGTILLHLANQEEEREAFVSYIDSMLDLLVPEMGVLDREERKDILFLGPDEHTAELMNWAALYAQSRGYPFWKAFTTGKAPELGGVPHDLYGMTTRGVHEYVLGILGRLGLEEESLTKIQTGGPDGDLGSNEILISHDRTIGVIDGSGVLYDPQGLDRQELARLAKARVPVDRYDRGHLSATGFFVSINDREVRLPDGTAAPNGEDFRNKFHLHPLAKADLFVPCGGRPAAVNITNWSQLLDERGQPKFRIIVEGANLFLTEEARLRLEGRGVLIIKDASANKGGVTSSSLEVYASLALTDEEYEGQMRVKSGRPPEFRRRYIEEIQRTIQSNARSEFEALWREHEATRKPLTLLSNELSDRINALTDAVVASGLTEDSGLMARIVKLYTPPSLLELVGLENILSRVPASYLKAIAATTVATRFIYSRGLRANEVDFFDFVRGL